MTILTSKKTLMRILVVLVLILVTWGAFVAYQGLKESSIFGSGTGADDSSGEEVAKDPAKETEAANVQDPKAPEIQGTQGTSAREGNAQDSSLEAVLGEALDISNAGDQEFFINYRLDRERVRGQQVELLRTVIDDADSDPAIRKEAQNKLLKISDSMDQELQLEALIKAKGFAEAALFVQQESATAILRKEGMSDFEVSTVADIISQVTGHNLENIVVIPK